MSIRTRIIVVAVVLAVQSMGGLAAAGDAFDDYGPRENVSENRFLAGIEDRIIRAKYIAVGFATKISEEAIRGNGQGQRLVTAMFHASEVLKPTPGKEPGKFFVRKMIYMPSFPGTPINPPGMKPRMVRITGENLDRQFAMAFYKYEHKPPMPCVLFFEKGELGWVPFYCFGQPEEMQWAEPIQRISELIRRKDLRPLDIRNALDPRLPLFAQESLIRLYFRTKPSADEIAEFYNVMQHRNLSLSDYVLCAAAAKASDDAEHDRADRGLAEGLARCLEQSGSVSQDGHDCIRKLIEATGPVHAREAIESQLTRLRIDPPQSD